MKKGGTTSNIQHRTPNIHFLEGLRLKVEGLRQEARGGYAGRRSGGVLRLGQPRSGGGRQGCVIDRPHPGPLPQERGKRSPLLGKIQLLDWSDGWGDGISRQRRGVRQSSAAFACHLRSLVEIKRPLQTKWLSSAGRCGESLSGGVLRLGQPRSGGRRRWFAGSGFCRFVDVHGWRERQRTAALHNLAGERRPVVA